MDNKQNENSNKPENNQITTAKKLDKTKLITIKKQPIEINKFKQLMNYWNNKAYVTTHLMLEESQIELIRKGHNINEILEWYFKRRESFKRNGL